MAMPYYMRREEAKAKRLQELIARLNKAPTANG
jgi:hypothetical protein